MKNGYKYKIDVNHYESATFPVALYRWEPGTWRGKWAHVESHRTQEAAQAHYDSISDQVSGLPKYL